MVVVKQNHPVTSNEWHFFTWGDGGHYGAGNGGTAGEEQVGVLGDVQSLRLGESASQHAAVTTATVTCGPSAGARPTTVRPN